MCRKVLLVCTVINLLACSVLQAGSYGGGTGTSVDPFQIWTPTHFNNIGFNSQDWCKHFKLMDDICMSEYDHSMIGNFSILFTGTFDGNDHSICDVIYNAPLDIDCGGVFGYIHKAVIYDLGIKNINLKGSNYNVGGLVGYNDGTILRCSVQGSIFGRNAVGGLVGYNNKLIWNCSADCSITGQIAVGGLIGRNYGDILNSRAAGTVNTLQRSGGLVGCNYDQIRDCYATGSVTGYGSDLGGLVGYNYYEDGYRGTITRCYATGRVNCTAVYVEDNFGGLVGYNYKGIVDDCYATGAVSGYRYVGGLIGTNFSGTISTCYSTGFVSGRTAVGGLLGQSWSGVTACYWNVSSSGTSEGIGYGVNPDMGQIIGVTSF